MISTARKRFLLITAALMLAGLGRAEKPDWLSKVGARTFPDKPAVYRVSDYGPHKDRVIASTDAIQKAIDECSKNGGGKVVFEPGVYHTGAIFLKDNVNLEIGEDVELWALIGLKYYPEIVTRVAGIEMQWPCGVINVIDCKNVAVTGKGLIHAQGKYHWENYWNLREEYEPKGLRWASDYDCKRVRTFQIKNASDLTLRDFTVKQSGFWTVQIMYSEHVTVDGITVRNNIDGKGPSTDGVNVDSSRYVHILNCDTDGNDDNYCVKAGRDADGLRVNRPSEYVYIHDCIARRGGGLLVIGSETSGWIRHVKVENMKAMGCGNIIHLKSAFTRGGGIEDIELSNVTGEAGNFVSVNVNWNPSYSYAALPEGMNEANMPAHWKTMLREVPREKGIPQIRNIRVSDCDVSVSQAFRVTGIEESYMENFTIENCKVNAARAGSIEYAKDWTLNNVTVNARDNKEVAIKNSQNINWKK